MVQPLGRQADTEHEVHGLSFTRGFCDCSSTLMNPEFTTLKVLLKRRIDLISDHAFRDLDAPGHLAALQQISELISKEHLRLRPLLSGRLAHFLQQASYSKALEYLDEN
jgi:hypothetical protein